MKTGNITSMIGSGASTTLAVVCPACWPALGSLLGSLGLSALASTVILKPLLLLFLVIAAVGFVRGYRAHNVPWPMVAGLVGGSLLYIGKWSCSTLRCSMVAWRFSSQHPLQTRCFVAGQVHAAQMASAIPLLQKAPNKMRGRS